jgi:hypothetical protein
LLYGFLGDNGDAKKLGEKHIAVSIILIRSFMLNRYLDLFCNRTNVAGCLISNGFNVRSLVTINGDLLCLYMYANLESVKYIRWALQNKSNIFSLSSFEINILFKKAFKAFNLE